MTDDDHNSKNPAQPKKPGQFPPGKSGNSRGRPRKFKRIEEYAVAALQQKVKMTMNGKPGRYTLAEIIGTSIAHDAARGNKHARELLIVLEAKLVPPAEPEILKVTMVLEEDTGCPECWLRKA